MIPNIIITGGNKTKRNLLFKILFSNIETEVITVKGLKNKYISTRFKNISSTSSFWVIKGISKTSKRVVSTLMSGQDIKINIQSEPIRILSIPQKIFIEPKHVVEQFSFSFMRRCIFFDVDTLTIDELIEKSKEVGVTLNLPQ